MTNTEKEKQCLKPFAEETDWMRQAFWFEVICAVLE